MKGARVLGPAFKRIHRLYEFILNIIIEKKRSDNKWQKKRTKPMFK
jgi:alpha-D-ribose 1-methylphosphonate 5-triphosphate synthase subunit PhnI